MVGLSHLRVFLIGAPSWGERREILGQWGFFFRETVGSEGQDEQNFLRISEKFVAILGKWKKITFFFLLILYLIYLHFLFYLEFILTIIQCLWSIILIFQEICDEETNIQVQNIFVSDHNDDWCYINKMVKLKNSQCSISISSGYYFNV